MEETTPLLGWRGRGFFGWFLHHREITSLLFQCNGRFSSIMYRVKLDVKNGLDMAVLGVNGPDMAVWTKLRLVSTLTSQSRADMIATRLKLV